MTISDAWQIAGAVIVSLGGGGVIVVALASWLGKVWAEKILEADRNRYQEQMAQLEGQIDAHNRRLQAQLEKTLFVTKVHFETEFKALTDVWAKLVQTRSALVQVRPMADFSPPGETDEERIDRLLDRLGVLKAATTEFKTEVFEHSPFYPSNIYEALGPCIEAADKERSQVATDDRRFMSEWYRDGKANREAIIEHADTVSELIRERLATLAVPYRTVLNV